MSEYDETNRGVLFKNDKEGGNPNWPDYKGSINVDGVDYWLSCWVKTSKKGNKFMSLAVKPKGVNAPPQAPVTREETSQAEPFNDDIPF